MDGFDPHHFLPYVGLVGLWLAHWRWSQSQKAAQQKEREGLIEWRTRMDEAVRNNTGYIKRVEQEGKDADRDHKALFDEIRADLGELKNGQTRIEEQLRKRNGGG